MVFPFRSKVVHCCTGSFLVPYAATVAMSGCTCVIEYFGDERSAVITVSAVVMNGQGVWTARSGYSVVFSAACCLEVSLCVAADATSGSKINERGVAIGVVVHMGVVFDVTMLRTFLVRSVTWLWSRVFFCLSWSMTMFVWSTWMPVKVIILEVYIVSIFRLIALSKTVSWLVMNGLIPLFIRSVSIV